MTQSSSEHRSFGKRRLGLDVIGWAAAVALVAFTYRLDTTHALLLAGVAVVFQVGLGLAQGVYSRRSGFSVLGEIGVVIGTVTLTTFLIVMAKIATNAQFVRTGAILVGGVLALAFTVGARFIWYVATERLKRERGREKRALKRPVRFPLDQSLALAEQILAQISLTGAVLHCSCAGSLRRMQSTVGDIDLIVASDRPKEVVDAFFSLATGQSILKVPKREWQTHAVALFDGVQVELWVVPPAFYAAALIFKSGTRAHNFAMYKWVLKYGHSSSRTWERVRYRFSYLYTTVFLPLLHRIPMEEEEIDLLSRIPPRGDGFQTEEDVYERVGLQWIPPTLREGEGELEIASQRRIPKVVELTDIRGDFLGGAISAGHASNQELVSAAVDRGYEHITITDRFRDRGHFDLASIECQRMEIQALNARWGGKIALFYGAELNVGLEGELDCPDSMIEHFDVVMASIQSDTDQDRDRNRLTRRLVRVMQHPKLHILALPIGSLGERERCIFDTDEVCRAASRQRVALEINADPRRLDLPSEYVRRARVNDVLFAISTKARCVADLAYMRFGVSAAQRCYATADATINAWHPARLRRFLTVKS